MITRYVLIAAALCVLALAFAALFVPAVGAELHKALLTPLIAAFYAVRAYIIRLPQLLLWLLPIAIVTILIVRSILSLPRSERRRRRERRPKAGEGKLAELIRQIQRTRVSRFARVRVCRRLTETAVRLLAKRRGIPIEEARRRMRAADWQADPRVIAFLVPHRHHRRPSGGKGFLMEFAGTLSFLERFHREG